MAQFSGRLYESDSDFDRLLALVNAEEAVEKLGDPTTAEQLRLGLEQPNLNPLRDQYLWFDETGGLVAGATLIAQHGEEEDQGRFRFHVHPSVRGSEIESLIFEWLINTVRERFPADESGKPLVLRTRIHEDDKYHSGVLLARGFPVERYYLTLKRSLEEPVDQPRVPGGFTLRHTEEGDGPAYVEMFNQSFIDHWNHHPWNLEEYEHYEREPSYDRTLNLIAVAEDGTFAGFCWAGFEKADDPGGVSWIHLLGTRRGYRGIGLGRALLLAGMRRLQERGSKTVRLRVDAENPTGATQLYDSVSFVRDFALAFYSRDMRKD